MCCSLIIQENVRFQLDHIQLTIADYSTEKNKMQEKVSGLYCWSDPKTAEIVKK